MVFTVSYWGQNKGKAQIPGSILIYLGINDPYIGLPLTSSYTGKVDSTSVPMPHFGIISPLNTWKQMAEKLIKANIEFIIPPTLRYKNIPGEQNTMFFIDPFGNSLEFKSFLDINEVINT